MISISFHNTSFNSQPYRAYLKHFLKTLKGLVLELGQDLMVFYKYLYKTPKQVFSKYWNKNCLKRNNQRTDICVCGLQKK